MFFNPQAIDRAIGDIQKAIQSIDVDGLLLVREDLQAELAIMAPTDTPVRNRLNRIQGNGKAQNSVGLVKLCKFGEHLENGDTNIKTIPSQATKVEGVETKHTGRIQKGQKNPWHRASVIARKEKSGYKAWNKGLTKNDSPSVMRYSIDRLGKDNPIWKKKNAELFLLNNGLTTRILYRGSIDNPSPNWRRQFSVNQKKSILKRAGYKCECCGCELTYEITQADHILALRLGGKTVIANGQALCNKCHLLKTKVDKKLIRQDIVRTLQKCNEMLRNVASATY